ncbi:MULTISPECIES: RNA polymerase sigma factor [unclassified Streptomyces]|uniref:RNA polymerase sigma factor n=1 Tax=unclassified Streptomyces TaxID=2593676 RepID=UPI00225ADACC|nr:MULTISPECIES: SigE family RNA polymerase sigma factor [unclassified Streptomyces]MCX4529648.1 SigE family RNA polymerase sigma factor [Streptomyces sp. NBC_01551]MCX4539780.1 SigE family RNA polymerase sigma factor [Streptomyces sp. NBC_01565]
MLHLVSTAGPLAPGHGRERRGPWWWLLRRERPAPAAERRPRQFSYTYGQEQDRSGSGHGDFGQSPTVSALYHAHRLRMVRLAVLLVDDLATAEDVVQDAFTALYRRHGEHITEVDNALGYLRTAVVNTSRSVLRRRRTARAWTPPEAADVPSAEAHVVLDEAHREVLAALGRLTPRRRQVLVLRYWADLSEAEIAATLGISRGAVKSNASRGLDALERILEGRI